LLIFSQIALQQQIEALQHQQQALYQQQLASSSVMSFQTPGLGPNRGVHRRVQSTMAGGPGANFQNPMGQFANLPSMGVGLDGQTQNISRGHGRRHSVNVVNKNTGNTGSNSFAFPSTQEGFDDGFTPPPGFNGGHSRQVSRADSTWRISK
jgi:protein SSD1